MKQQQQQEKKTVEMSDESSETEKPTKTFEGGFFQVNSPVKTGKLQFTT